MKHARAVMALAVAVGLMGGRAEGVPYYWDTDGNTAGFGNVAGTWGTSAFWSPDSTGASGTALTTITTSDGVNFGTATLTLGSTAAAVGVAAAGVTVNTITIGAAQITPITLGTGGNTITLGGTTPTITVNSTANYTSAITSIIAGTTLAKAGAGTLTLSGANTYSGATTISGGTLQVSSLASATVASNLGQFPTAGAAGLLLGAATLRYTGGSVSIDRGFTLTNSGTIDVNAASTALTLGACSLGAFTFTATGGAGSSLSLGAVTLTGAATLNPTTTSLTVASVTAGSALNLTLGGTSTGNTVAGAIATTTGQLIKNTASTWTLSGVNNYSGVTTVSAGRLIIGSGGSLAAGSAVTVSAGALGGSGTVNGTVTVSGTGGINLSDGAIGTLTLGSTLAITGAASANNLVFDLANAGATVDKVAATGAFSMTTSGAGVVSPNQLGGAANRLTAGTYDLITAGSGITAGGGQFRLASTRAFGQTFSLADTTTTALKLTTTQVGAAAGNVTLTAASGSWAASGSFTPAVVPDYQSNVSINSGVGTTPLNGSTDINSLNFGLAATAAVTISAGTASAGTPASMLVLEAAGVNGNTAGNGITLSNLSGTHTISANIGLAASQTWTVTTGGGLTVSGVVSDFGGGYGLTKAGGGTLTLSGANSFSGPLTIANGTVRADSSTIGNKGVNGLLGAGTTLVLGGSGTTGRLAIQVDGGVTINQDITLATGGMGEFQFGNGNWGLPFQITNADRSLALSGNISGTGNFVKLGGAALVLSGYNTWSGTTTVNEGALRLNSAFALPGGIGATGGASALTINGNPSYGGAVVQLGGSSGDFLRGLGTGIDQFQIPGGVSGFDSNSGARNVIVGNNPAFELQWGIPTFNPSALLLGYHSAISGGTLTLQNKIDLNAATRTITVNASTATLSGDIRTTSGTAGITKTGAGTLVLSGANTYNGPTTISAGTLTLSSAGAVGGTSQIVLGGTSTLHVNFANLSLAALATGGGVPFGTFLHR